MALSTQRHGSCRLRAILSGLPGRRRLPSVLTLTIRPAASLLLASTMLTSTMLTSTMLAAGAPGTAPVHRLQAPPPLPVALTIPVEPLGFQPPNRADMTFRIPSTTLDFVDDQHLLFTFHKAALMRRAEQEPEDDEDQTIAALLLELPSGKVVERTTWRMHDKGRYLWTLGHGRFLERERNSFYLYDKTLATRAPYLETKGSFRTVELSPDRSRMLVEYQETLDARSTAPGSAAPNAPTLGDVPRSATRHIVRMLIVDTQANKVLKYADLATAIGLPLMQGGYLDVRADPARSKQWTVLLVPFGGTARPLTQLTSGCQPTLQPISEQSFLAQLCIPYTSDHLMQAYDLDGKKQWEQQWEARYIWPSFAYSENGLRFAYESIQLDHPIAALDPISETSITGQPVGVFDVADGTLRLVVGALPVLSAGQNYALSPNGEGFAVLRQGAIEVYKLPPATVR